MKTAQLWWDIHRADLVSVSKLVKSEVASERTIYRHIKDLIGQRLVTKKQSGARPVYRLLLNPDPSSSGL